MLRVRCTPVTSECHSPDFGALLPSVSVLVGSWIWELRRWFVQRQKNRGDAYNREVVGLITRVQAARNTGDIGVLRRQLFQLLTGRGVRAGRGSDFRGIVPVVPRGVGGAGHQGPMLRPPHQTPHT
jgi:hypothetical protein